MRAAILLLALGLVACDSSRPPTAPTPRPEPSISTLPPVSSVLQISVIGDQWITLSSAPVQMTARLITSTTPLEYVDGGQGVTWSIDPQGIAAVDQQGRVTPQASGAARVIATYGDKQSFNPIRVLPDYAGDWSGEFVVTGCTGGHDFRECGRIMQGEPGTGISTGRYPFTLTLAQFRDAVTGTLREVRANGDIVAPIAGFVRLNGTLVLEATVPQPDHQPFRVINWSSVTNAAATSMSGAFTQYEPRRTAFGDPYVVRTENEFVNMPHAR